MFETFKNAWKVPDIKKKLIYTAIIIILFRVGSAIPVPFVDSAALGKYFEGSAGSSILGYFNLLSGDAFSKATIFALSISPYITSSIVMQLLAVAIPALERLSKSGPDGQAKIQKITRIVTIVLSVVMAYGYYLTIKSQGFLYTTGVFECLIIIASFTAGACTIMWLGERIDENGIGNGISMILFASIVSRFPTMFGQVLTYITAGNYLYILYTLIAVVFMLAVVALVVFITNAERRLPVQYAKRQVGRRVYGGNSTFLPLKLNMTGVMPIIFGQAIVSLPATLALIFPSWEKGVEKWFSTASPYPFYAIAYLIMIIAFAYFYVSISFNPMEVASNLQKNGGTIAGHRPGKATADYISKILNRVTFLGALFLAFIAVFPIIIVMIRAITGADASYIFSQLAFGGSSLLIIVGVALETTREIEAQITMRHYKGFLE
ncbi:preprotein translocase subunit SecY [Eubacteriales bacterium OttesenSCG-928-G02]|nr:preprotein translocase subunit SecY [Eubacteriales bacterium OttesenSCG-928-G02]